MVSRGHAIEATDRHDDRNGVVAAVLRVRQGKDEARQHCVFARLRVTIVDGLIRVGPAIGGIGRERIRRIRNGHRPCGSRIEDSRPTDGRGPRLVPVAAGYAPGRGRDFGAYAVGPK